MARNQWSPWFLCSLALMVCLALSLPAQARGGGGHSSRSGSQAPNVGAKSSGSTSDWHTHIHPNATEAAKKTKKPAIHDISITKKVDTSSPKMMSSKPSGTFKPNKSRVDPYKSYKFR